MTQTEPRKSRFRVFSVDTRPLKIAAYRRLLIGEVVTVVGSQMTVVAVQQQIFSLTGSSGWVGAASFAALVPLVTFGLLGGAIADTYDRRTILMFTSVGIAVTSVGLFVNGILAHPSVIAIFVLLAVQQSLVAVNNPTRSAVVPRLVPAELIPSANALAMSIFSVGVLCGPLLAGALLPLVGISGVFLIDALTLVAILWAVVLLPPIRRLGSPDAKRARVLDGLRYLRGRDVLLLSFVVDIAAMIFGMPRALFPQMAEQTFGGPPEGGIQLGLLNVGLGLGAALGGLFSGWLARVHRQGLAIVLAIVAWGAAMIGAGLTTTLWLAVIFLAAGGLADMISAVFRSTMLQVNATDEMRGRMQGVFLVVVAGGPRIADLLHGLVADWTSPRVAVVGGGILVIISMLVINAIWPALLRFRSEEPPNTRHTDTPSATESEIARLEEAE